jgi:hypothetical protein
MITLNYELDDKKLADSINSAIELKDNNEMFEQLSAVSKAKKEIEDALEQIAKIELVAKGFINSKAKQLYGKDWQTVTGQGYKITRSSTGNIYIRNPDLPVSKKFIELKESLLTKVIDAELEKTGKLPKGIELNPSRGESIRITIK